MKFVLLSDDDCSLRVARVVGKGSKVILGRRFEMLLCRFINGLSGRRADMETKPFLAPAARVKAEYEDEYPCDSPRHNYNAAMLHLLEILARNPK